MSFDRARNIEIAEQFMDNRLYERQLMFFFFRKELPVNGVLNISILAPEDKELAVRFYVQSYPTVVFEQFMISGPLLGISLFNLTLAAGGYDVTNIVDTTVYEDYSVSPSLRLLFQDGLPVGPVEGGSSEKKLLQGVMLIDPGQKLLYRFSVDGKGGIIEGICYLWTTPREESLNQYFSSKRYGINTGKT